MKTENKIITDSEIIKQLLETLRYSALAFATELGYKSHSTIDHILKGRNNISDDLIERIIKKFPEVHYWFLKRGQAPVLLNEKLKNNQAELLGVKVGVENPDYSLETFATLKNIEKILLKIVTILEIK
ncbi:MAG: helix-turn-helix transcriptional regulator [Flavobacterium sp.]|nr:helix-turn-helix transcriptional regulator [Flavobacterium sp.]